MKNVILAILLTMVAMGAIDMATAQDGNLSELVPIEVDVSDTQKIQEYIVWGVKIVAVIIILVSIAIFGFNVLAAQRANKEAMETGRGQGVMGNLGVGFVLLVFAGAIAILLWNAAPFIATVAAPGGGT